MQTLLRRTKLRLTWTAGSLTVPSSKSSCPTSLSAPARPLPVPGHPRPHDSATVATSTAPASVPSLGPALGPALPSTADVATIRHLESPSAGAPTADADPQHAPRTALPAHPAARARGLRHDAVRTDWVPEGGRLATSEVGMGVCGGRGAILYGQAARTLAPARSRGQGLGHCHILRIRGIVGAGAGAGPSVGERGAIAEMILGTAGPGPQRRRKVVSSVVLPGLCVCLSSYQLYRCGPCIFIFATYIFRLVAKGPR